MTSLTHWPTFKWNPRMLSRSHASTWRVRPCLCNMTAGHGATAARLAPDQKVGGSNLFAFTPKAMPRFVAGHCFSAFSISIQCVKVAYPRSKAAPLHDRRKYDATLQTHANCFAICFLRFDRKLFIANALERRGCLPSAMASPYGKTAVEVALTLLHIERCCRMQL